MSRLLSAERLIELLEESDHGEPRSYSGRAMYGRRCVGIVVEQDAELALGTDLAALAAEETDEEDLCELLDQLAATMHLARTDSMGRDVIVYWPDIEWPEGRKEDD